MDSGKTEAEAQVGTDSEQIKQRIVKRRLALSQKVDELKTRFLKLSGKRIGKDKSMAAKKASTSSKARKGKSSSTGKSSSGGSKASKGRGSSFMTAAKKVVEKVATRAAVGAMEGALTGVTEEVGKMDKTGKKGSTKQSSTKKSAGK